MYTIKNKGLKIDQTNKRIIMNRSLANIKLLNLGSSINDCVSILLQGKNNLLIINKTNTYIHQNKTQSCTNKTNYYH
jgi:hypothetical protein